MLEELGGAMAAKRRMDAQPDDPDVRDIDVLVTFVERDWQPLESKLAQIPRAAWPPGAAKIEEAVASISKTLRRPL
jgi:hypothetical protein